jgi:hypothetical protein
MQTKTILRSGYKRHGYYRSPYTRSTGAHVRGVRVKATYVPASRIPGRGRAAVTGHKGKKLIPMKDYRHLRVYGYSFKSDSSNRHHALKKATQSKGFLWPIHRLTALRTLYRNAEPRLSRKASHDLKYVQRLYRAHKKTHGREKRKKHSHH